MAHPIDSFVGRQIERLRKSRGFSLIEAGRLIGVDPFAFKRFEAGTERIDARALQRLCLAFDTPPRYFFPDFQAKSRSAGDR